MLRHNDVGPEVKFVLLGEFFQRINDVLSSPIFAEEFSVLVAREGQFVWFTGSIESYSGFSVWWVFHSCPWVFASYGAPCGSS